MHRFLRLPTLLITAAAVSSCIVPGKYRIYRVASAETVQQLDCYNGTPPADAALDSNTFRTGGTFGIFASETDTFWLDMEGQALEGEKTKPGDYTFEGEMIDVTQVMNATTTSINRVTVDLEIGGRKISGVTTTQMITQCQGSACPMGVNSSCTTTTSWEGSEVKDAELEHPI